MCQVIIEDNPVNERLLYSSTDNPRSLQHICRLKIRHTMARNGRLGNSEGVDKLRIPGMLRRFVGYHDYGDSDSES